MSSPDQKPRYSYRPTIDLYIVDRLDQISLKYRRNSFTTVHSLVVLTNINETKKLEMVNTLFEDAWKAHISNFLVLMFDNVIQAWTFMTYVSFEFDCVTLSHKIIETFTNDNYTREMKIPFEKLFPEKMQNMKKCPVHVSVAEIEPYVIFRTSNSDFDGIDIKIVLEIGKHMNFTPKFIRPTDGQRRGVAYENGTMTGAMQLVLSGVANLTIGAYSQTRNRSMWLSFGAAYLQDISVFAFRNKYIPPSSLDHLMGPFSSSSWLLILTTICLAAIFILLTKRLNVQRRRFLIGGKLHRTPILNGFLLVIGGSISNRKMEQRRYFGTFARTLTMLWILLFFFIRSLYEGGLFTIFHKPPQSFKCDTFDKIRSHQCKVILSKSTVEFLVSLNVSPSQ